MTSNKTSSVSKSITIAAFLANIFDEKKIRNVFEKAEMLTEKASKGEYGVHSKNTYIMNEPGCAELKKWILSEVLDFGLNTLGYDYPEYTFSQTWVSWKEPGQFHTAHTHPNSMISAVFFYGHSEENTPAKQVDWIENA